MTGVYFLTGLLLGLGGGLWAIHWRFMRKYMQITDIIHANRHRHPALILERVQKHVHIVSHKRF